MAGGYHPGRCVLSIHPSLSSPEAPLGLACCSCVPQRYVGVLGALPHASACGLIGTRALQVWLHGRKATGLAGPESRDWCPWKRVEFGHSTPKEHGVTEAVDWVMWPQLRLLGPRRTLPEPAEGVACQQLDLGGLAFSEPGEDWRLFDQPVGLRYSWSQEVSPPLLSCSCSHAGSTGAHSVDAALPSIARALQSCGRVTGPGLPFFLVRPRATLCWAPP